MSFLYEYWMIMRRRNLRGELESIHVACLSEVSIGVDFPITCSFNSGDHRSKTVLLLQFMTSFS